MTHLPTNSFVDLQAQCQKKEIDSAKRKGKFRPRTILQADLFGLPYVYDVLDAIAIADGK